MRVGGGGVLRNNVCEISLSVPVCVRVCLSLHWDERGGGGGGGGKDGDLNKGGRCGSGRIGVQDVRVAGACVCVCVCVCVHMCVCVFRYVCVCVHIHVQVNMHAQICIYWQT